jgi:hypothetical protein
MYDFATARRGYAPKQVDRAVAVLFKERDAAWERLSLLGTRIRELEVGLAEAVQAAEETAPTNFLALGERAAGLLALAEVAAAALREEAQRAAETLRSQAHEDGWRLAEEAASYAEATRAEADRTAALALEQTRAESEQYWGEADREHRALEEHAAQDAAGARARMEQAQAQAETELTARRQAAEEELAALEARWREQEEQIAAAADEQMRDIAQHRKQVLGRVAEIEAEAAARVDRMLERAQRNAEQILDAAERERQLYQQRQEGVQQQLGRIRETLAAVTSGRHPADQARAMGLAWPVEDADPAAELPGTPLPAAPLHGPDCEGTPGDHRRTG